MKKKLIMFFPFLLIALSCSSFIIEEDSKILRKYENQVYLTLDKFEANGSVIEKGKEVKIIITEGDKWIKVHAYPAGEEMLKAHRTIILYLFNDEFKDEIFDIKKFEARLFSVVQPKK